MSIFKSKLFKKLMITTIVLSALMCFIIGIIGYSTYKTDMEDMYYEYADKVLAVSAQTFDGDKIADAIDEYNEYEKLNPTVSDKEKNDYVSKYIQKDIAGDGFANMDYAKDETAISYLYVLYFPDLNDNTDMRYVFYANTQADRDQGIPDSIFGSKCGDEYTEDIYDMVYDIQSGNYISHKNYVTNMYQGVGKPEMVFTIFRPIYDSNGNVVCVAGGDIYIRQIEETLSRYIYAISISGVVLIVLFLGGFTVITKKSIVEPTMTVTANVTDYINQLKSTDSPEELDFKNIDIKTDTEINIIAKGINELTQTLKVYTNNLKTVTSEKERMGTELNVAAKIQASMLPNIFPPFPDRQEFDIYASMDPAKEVGGDFYDFFLIDDDHLCMVMADVSGKGVPASLFMVRAKTLLKTVALRGISPKEILENVNDQLCENNDEEMFVTVWLGILTISTGKIVYANAGHENPVIYRAGGKYEMIVEKHGFVLAGMEGMRYKEFEHQLNHGDRFFIYTDGLPEATNAENELFGNERLIEGLNVLIDETIENVVMGMSTYVEAFVDEAPQFDDLTMLIMEYK